MLNHNACTCFAMMSSSELPIYHKLLGKILWCVCGYIAITLRNF